jgi:hypothetical protein
VDAALVRNTAAASYESDAEEIARVLVRHYGDEAEAVLERIPGYLASVRAVKAPTKRSRRAS